MWCFFFSIGASTFTHILTTSNTQNMSHYTLSMKNETDTILATDLVISDKQTGKRKDDFHWIGVKGHHGQLQIIGSKPEALLPITYQASDGSILVRLKSGNPLLPIMKAIEAQLQGKYDTTDGELQPYLKEPVQVNYDYTMKIKARYAVLDPQGQQDLSQGNELDR